jgi:hypothetical protein
MPKKISIFMSLMPWAFLLSFYSLIIRFKVKYGLWPLSNPIDPKKIDMSRHIFLTNILIFATFLSIPFVCYFGYKTLKDRNPKGIAFFLVCLLGLIIAIYLLKFGRMTEWYFD